MIKRTYVPYWLWEETQTDMWRTAGDREELLTLAIELTGHHCLYGIFMSRVIEEWPMSSLHNLSNTTQNRRAWIGHAACAMAINCPEDVVRQAWWMLSDAQRFNANVQADIFIKRWEAGQCRKDQLELMF